MVQKEMRVPPQNIEAEQALLGSVLIRPTTINEVIDLISPESFYVEKHRIIFSSMLELHNRAEPIDTLSLSSKLKGKQLLETIGGNEYITELATRVPSSSNARYYAEIISTKSVLRGLIEAGADITEMGFNENEDIEVIMDDAEKKIFRITQSPKSNKFMNIKEFLPDVWENMERLHEHKGEIRGVSTGFKGLDNMLSGMQKSDMVILAARPSMGKTSLALDIARKASMHQNVAVGFFSLEMSAQQLVDRMVSSESGVDFRKIRTGRGLTEDDFSEVKEAMARLSAAPLYIDDQAGNSILKMRATARRLKAQHNLDLIIIDYLQLITTNKQFDSMVNQVTEISRAIKGLARELDVPVLCLSQLSRAVESRGGKPRLSDLRDSGAIEQDADVVMFIHREMNEDGGGRQQHAELLIEKHRNGPTGVVPLYFDAERVTFMDVEYNEFGGFHEDNVNRPNHGGPLTGPPADSDNPDSLVGRSF